MSNNGDTHRVFKVGKDEVRGLGSFHKTLPHNKYGEVDKKDFQKLVTATQGDGSGFKAVPKGGSDAAPLTNPQAGLAHDQLTRHPAAYSMPPAPTVLSVTTAAEMTELYWMALLRDLPFDKFPSQTDLAVAAGEIQSRFHLAVADVADAGRLIPGVDVPGAAGGLPQITPENIFRYGLPGEEFGPLISQFFLRTIQFGTQTIDQRQRPYKKGSNFLTSFDDWHRAQCTGLDGDGQAYPKANEHGPDNFEVKPRYISTMRDLARFVNKDALHQAYFNAALLLLSGGAKWTQGNPYGDKGELKDREAGFGVLGGPHILALVSEVATRALKIVWNQKWQVHLRLRPEAYAGLVHVQNLGIGKGDKRPYGLPDWVASSEAATRVKNLPPKTLLLPMAFTPGSPTHPSYGAGHATVAGICVTVLKAYFQTFTTSDDGVDTPVPFRTLTERSEPFGKGHQIEAWVPGVVAKPGGDEGTLTALPKAEADKLTIEGELNKLAANVAGGRSMGGVHWRTDNTRSLVLGEAIAAQVLADITTDVNERPTFQFRTFSRGADGKPKKVTIRQGRIFVDGTLVDTNSSAL